MVLVSSISSFFTNKTSLTNKWMSFSSCNSALEIDAKVALFMILVSVFVLCKKNCYAINSVTKRAKVKFSRKFWRRTFLVFGQQS